MSVEEVMERAATERIREIRSRNRPSAEELARSSTRKSVPLPQPPVVEPEAQPVEPIDLDALGGAQ